MDTISAQILQCAANCEIMLQSGDPIDLVLPELESIIMTLEEDESSLPWENAVIQHVESIIRLLSVEANYNMCGQGSTNILLPIENCQKITSL